MQYLFAEVYAVKISKGLIGVSALAAALAVSPAAFANPCGGFSQGASNSGYGNQGMNGWQSSSTTPSGQAANWNGNWSRGRYQDYRSGVTERYSRLTQEANDAINHDPQLQDEDVHAWVTANGVVVLRGEADSAAQALRAQRIIAQYTGLKDFDNELYYPDMYGGQATKTESENAENQNAENQDNENAENENNRNAASESNENNENAASQNNQNNGASSPSGPSTGQNQGANSSSGSDSGNNQ
jgi:hypothetical protein